MEEDDPISFIESHTFHIPEMKVVALVHLGNGDVITAVVDVFLMKHPAWLLYANEHCSHLLLNDPHHDGVGRYENLDEYVVSAILDWRLFEGLPKFCKYLFFYFFTFVFNSFFRINSLVVRSAMHTSSLCA